MAEFVHRQVRVLLPLSLSLFSGNLFSRKIGIQIVYTVGSGIRADSHAFRLLRLDQSREFDPGSEYNGFLRNSNAVALFASGVSVWQSEPFIHELRRRAAACIPRRQPTKRFKTSLIFR